MSSGVLERIVERTLSDVAERRAAEPIPRPRTASPPRGFRKALGGPGLGLIAEVKPRSPSKGDLRPLTALEPVLDAYRRRASAVSVLVDGPFFGGSLELLARVRAALELPVLAKGFLLEPYQLEEAYAAGADAVLLIARLLSGRALRDLIELAHARGLDALVEVHSHEELEHALGAGARLIGVNARDLDTLAIDLSAARALLDRVPTGVVRVAESGLESREEVDKLRGLADAALIGSAFMAASDVDRAMEALGF